MENSDFTSKLGVKNWPWLRFIGCFHIDPYIIGEQQNSLQHWCLKSKLFINKPVCVIYYGVKVYGTAQYYRGQLSIMERACFPNAPGLSQHLTIPRGSLILHGTFHMPPQWWTYVRGAWWDHSSVMAVMTGCASVFDKCHINMLYCASVYGLITWCLWAKHLFCDWSHEHEWWTLYWAEVNVSLKIQILLFI